MRSLDSGVRTPPRGETLNFDFEKIVKNKKNKRNQLLLPVRKERLRVLARSVGKDNPTRVDDSCDRKKKQGAYEYDTTAVGGGGEEAHPGSEFRL